MKKGERKDWHVAVGAVAIAMCASAAFAGKAAFVVSEGAEGDEFLVDYVRVYEIVE